MPSSHRRAGLGHAALLHQVLRRHEKSRHVGRLVRHQAAQALQTFLVPSFFLQFQRQAIRKNTSRGSSTSMASIFSRRDNADIVGFLKSLCWARYSGQSNRRQAAAVFECRDLVRVQRQADVVQPVQQAMPAKRLDFERQLQPGSSVMRQASRSTVSW